MTRAKAKPIKAVILPVLLENAPMTAKELFRISAHYPDECTQFSNGLSRLVQRNILTIDKSVYPWQYSLSRLGEAEALQPDRPFREARARKRRMRGLDEESEPDTVKVELSVTVKQPVRKPIKTPVDPIERKILEIMLKEGAITMQEVYLLSKSYGYAVVKGHLLMMLDMNYAEIDTSVDPLMYYLTDAGESFIQNHYALEVNQ